MKISKGKISLFVGIAMAVLFQPVAFGESDIPLDTPFILGVGEKATVDSDLQITVLNIEEDSRCPIDVTCIWEGRVRAEINLMKGQKNLGNHVIPSVIEDANTQVFDGYFIRITEVEPYPTSSTPIMPSEYQITFLVSQTKTLDSPLKQFKMGVPIEKIQCKEGLVLVIRSSNSSPACVKSDSAEKLQERGWAESPEDASMQPTIRTGTSSGFCLGYCFSEFTITHKGVTYSQTGQDYVSEEWADLPKKTSTSPISEKEWRDLVEIIDLEKFNSLPDRIGCPGCADAPVEWIEISHKGHTKKIEFEASDAIPEITHLIAKLQEIRSKTVNSLIDSFEECESAGNPIMESYPRQCRTSDGRNFVEEIAHMGDAMSVCQEFNGTWLQEFNECEGISEEQCHTMNGTFQECESACRHIPDAEICTAQCVAVCKVP